MRCCPLGVPRCRCEEISVNLQPTADQDLPARPLMAPANPKAATADAASGALAEVVRLMGLAPCEGAPGLNATRIPLRRLREGATLVFEGSRGHALYVLRCGSAKSVKTQEDGYEQVLAFHHAGDVLGFEAFHGGTHAASVVALEDSSVFMLPADELPHLRRVCPVFTDALELALSRQLLNAAAAAGLMAAVASEARLARFVLWWSERMSHIGRSPRRLHLRMGRRDIASFLGVAHATVSRSFTALANAGCLSVDNRDVEILDLEALHVRARNTRGPGFDAETHHHDTTAAHAVPAQAWSACV
ncbi:MAG: hypothetical protein C0505_07320 [Leptothrix sp. (in: Bacteria)]|nr:hypothetical protein [Leptothrix sp. (in: b-proteobacteria)]